MPWFRLSFGIALLAACSGNRAPGSASPRPIPAKIEQTPAPAVQPGVRQRLSHETVITTQSGATFQAPQGWWLDTSRGVIVLEAPDRLLKATLVETSEQDVVRAIAQSWQRIQPGFALKAQGLPKSPPPVRGWEITTNVEYETQTEQDDVVAALGRRYGGVTYVALLEGKKSAVSARGVQLDVALWSLKPKGMHEETFRGRTARVFDDRIAAELEAFVETARVKLDVPGVAVAVLQGGKVVFEKGFGVRTLGRNDAVTPKSLFLVGSITKSMTTMMQASLVDGGFFGWDTPVAKALPSFTLGSAELAGKLTMAHTACACSGIPRRDLEIVFEFRGVTPEQALARLKTLQPTTGFGEVFQYSNELVAAGGFAAAHVFEPKKSLGDAYDSAMRTRVFGPIGMKNTTLDFTSAVRAEHATPHAEGIDGKPRSISLSLEDYLLPLRPAGGVWSNLRDLSLYALTEMSGGVAPDGKRVISEANLLERRKPRVRIGDVESYGLGLVVGTFRDLPVSWHSGQTAGFAALMHLLPEQAIATIVLTNSNRGGTLCQLVQRKLAEELFDGRHLAGPRLAFFAESKREKVAKALQQTALEPDPALLKRLAGRYRNQTLGEVRLTSVGKAGIVDAGEWRSAFGQSKEAGGTIKLILLDPPLTGLVDFEVAGDDARPKLIVSLEQESFVFERAGP
jgi:CubicO group peptidase (beta-lactamase class C family)